MSHREIVLDTETTGLSPASGDKITEIGAVELIDRKPTGATLQLYIDPERDVPERAYEVHGMTREDLIELGGGRNFADRADEFLDFIRDSDLVIHNAGFDMGFINAELEQAGRPSLEGRNRIFDTLRFANLHYPGRRNNLDALCRRFDVENEHRDLHGALLDAQLLTRVYLALTREQNRLNFDNDAQERHLTVRSKVSYTPVDPALSRQLQAGPVSAADTERHRAFLDKLKAAADDAPAWPTRSSQGAGLTNASGLPEPSF